MQLGIVPVDDDSEDERSIEQHMATMQQQMVRTNCDVSVISDRMVRTYSQRRDVIHSAGTLSSVLQMYPALKDQTGFCFNIFILPLLHLHTGASTGG